MSEETFKSVTLLCILALMVAIIILFLRPEVVVNNYISSGNYTFDVGENALKIINYSRGG